MTRTSMRQLGKTITKNSVRTMFGGLNTNANNNALNMTRQNGYAGKNAIILTETEQPIFQANFSFCDGNDVCGD